MSAQSPVESSSTFFADKLPFHMMFVRYFYLYTLGNHSTSPWSVSTCYLFELMQVGNIQSFICLFWIFACLLYLCTHAVEKYFTIALTFELFEFLNIYPLVFFLNSCKWKIFHSRSRLRLRFFEIANFYPLLIFFNNFSTLALTFEN